MSSVKYISHMGDDLQVVNAARVSFNKKSDWDYGVGGALKEGDKKLISYLASHGHISPFGHCFASFHVKAPIFVARQLVKHKFLRWNEVSRRYVSSKPEVTALDFRYASLDKKQGSGGRVNDYVSDSTWMDFDEATQMALTAYDNAIKRGVCPEQARAILPATVMTEWYWSGSLDAFADMCNLRCKEDTQKETREVADLINSIMSEHFPHSWKALRT